MKALLIIGMLFMAGVASGQDSLAYVGNGSVKCTVKPFPIHFSAYVYCDIKDTVMTIIRYPSPPTTRLENGDVIGATSVSPYKVKVKRTYFDIYTIRDSKKVYITQLIKDEDYGDQGN